MRGADYVWSERTQSDIMREMLKGHAVTVQRQNNHVPRKQRCSQTV